MVIKAVTKRILGGDYPTVRLVEVAGLRSVFEVSNSVEDYRANQFGGERKQLETFLEYLSPGQSVWDVGANVGLFSLFAARKGATVDAFEPEPEFADHLRNNAELNGQPVTVHEVALSDENGSTTLYSDGVAGMSPSLSSNSGDRGEVTVPTKRGDAVAIDTPDVLKIDVEGAEAAVLDGMGDRLRDVETVFLELHPDLLPSFNSSPEEVRSLLSDAGFEATFKQTREEQTHYIFEHRRD